MKDLDNPITAESTFNPGRLPMSFQKDNSIFLLISNPAIEIEVLDLRNASGLFERNTYEERKNLYTRKNHLKAQLKNICIRPDLFQEITWFA